MTVAFQAPVFMAFLASCGLLLLQSPTQLCLAHATSVFYSSLSYSLLPTVNIVQMN